MSSTSTRVAVIGAGSSGIAACQVLHARGLEFDCFEKGSQVGGNWRYRNATAYRSLHINTSRRLMAFATYPMPDDLNTGYGEDGTRPATGTWHQVTAVVAREDSAMSLYIDGRPVDTRSAGNVWDAVGPLVMGAARAESPGHGFHGAVDQVRT